MSFYLDLVVKVVSLAPGLPVNEDIPCDYSRASLLGARPLSFADETTIAWTHDVDRDAKTESFERLDTFLQNYGLLDACLLPSFMVRDIIDGIYLRKNA